MKKKQTVSVGTIVCCMLAWGMAVAVGASRAVAQGTNSDNMIVSGEIGNRGGRLVVALRSEPKTLNPLLAADVSSREVISVTQADLIHINRSTQLTEPALAKSWKVSADGLQYTLNLRKGLRFSDGQPLDADDVIFTVRTLLDENTHATQRDLLIVGGKPITVRKMDSTTVVFQLTKPYGPGERLFDGLEILPRHLLEKTYQEGKLAQSGTLVTPPDQWAGAGPYRLKEYVPGQKLVLERNPFYWKSDAKGNALPYLDEVVFLFVPNADAQVLRFQSGETDAISRLTADNFAALSRQAKDYTMTDAGPGLEYNFLFFNLNVPGEKGSPDLARKSKWFQEVKFRQAVSAAIDRDSIVRLIYQGRGVALWGPVTPGNRRWADTSIPHGARSVERSRALLQEAGFSWRTGENGGQDLVDSEAKTVEFSILTSSSNAERTKMAAIVQDDLKELGMHVQVVPLEFRSLIDRVTQTKEYEACILGLASFDADPNADLNVWLSTGGTHLWNPSQAHPATSWESEMDSLMQRQMDAASFEQRKKLFDHVQEILAEYQPMIFLASPDILTGAKNTVGAFHPAVLEPYLLWNVEQLYVRNAR